MPRWYKDYPPSFQDRLVMDSDMSKNQLSLQLSSATTKDMAMYYCARDRVSGHHCEPRHKPPAGTQEGLGTGHEGLLRCNHSQVVLQTPGEVRTSGGTQVTRVCSGHKGALRSPGGSELQGVFRSPGVTQDQQGVLRSPESSEEPPRGAQNTSAGLRPEAGAEVSKGRVSCCVLDCFCAEIH